MWPLVNTFVSPGAAMDALVRRPRTLPALLVLILAGLIPVVIAQQRGIITLRLESDPRLAQLPPEQRRRFVEQSARLGPYSVAAGAVGGPVIGVLAAGGLFYALLLVWGKAHPSFRAVCAVVAHAWLPVALYSLLSVPVLLVQEPVEADLDNVLALSNPAFLVSADEFPVLHRVAASFDLFSLWVIALLSLGLSRLAGWSFSRALPVVLAPWALYIAVFRVLLR